MNQFNFKSQIATTIEQSERLIALGLKKETADMTHHYMYSTDDYELKDIEFSRIMHLQELVNKKPVLGRSGDDLYAKDVPAWSLHRLIEMMPNCLEMEDEEGETWEYLFHLSHVEVVYDVYLYERRFSEMANIYDNLISCIEWLIKEGYFNKEYLEE